jgi:GT2 family glycosyltransferase
METISVIIVSWNARGFLRDCLLSIRKCGGPLLHEIIVVDNASTDGSPNMVQADFPEVILIRTNENLGFAKANNIGMKQATGSLFALINSDVIVHDRCFDLLAAHLELHQEAGLVGPKVFGRDGQLQITCRQLPTLWNAACRALAVDAAFSRLSSSVNVPKNNEDFKNVEALNGCFWVARRIAVEQTGGLDERFFFYAEDIDWCKRFGDAGWMVQFIPTANATHFGGGSSANAPFRYSIEMLKANLRYWRKHRGVPGEWCFYLLSVIHHAVRLVPRGLKVLLERDANSKNAYKFRRSKLCLRWLLIGKGVQ